MGKASRDKGCRYERELVARLMDAGIKAERMPLSGAAGGSFSGDVMLNFLGHSPARFEAKKRANGFRELYRWITDHRGLFLAADRRETLAVIRLDDFLNLLKAAEAAHLPETTTVACPSSIIEK